MVGHRSFGQQLLYPSTFSILYGCEIKQAIMSIQFFTATIMWFVVRETSKHRTPFPPLLCDTSTALLEVPHNVRLSLKNTTKLSALEFHLKCSRISCGRSAY
jgi:hypothetical protein